MPIELITNRNVTAGIHVIFVYLNDIGGGLFINLLLFMIWSVITFGLFFTRKRTVGDGNFPACSVAGSFVIVLLSALLSLVEGLMNKYTWTAIIVIFLLSLLFFFFNRD